MDFITDNINSTLDDLIEQISTVDTKLEHNNGKVHRYRP